MQFTKAKLAAALLSVVAVTGIALSQADAASCYLGQSKRAVKIVGGSGYATPCRIDQCRNLNASATKTHINWDNMRLNIDYIYAIQAGPEPTISCRAEVSNDEWTVGDEFEF